MKRHPAFELFKRLFDEAAQTAPDNVEMPTYWVPRSVFYAQVHAAGIEAPKNINAFMAWEDSIGLPEFAHKIIAAHHKKAGTDFTPMEKGQWRLRNKMRMRKAQP